MAKFRKKPIVIEAVQWNGDAGLANEFIGECFGLNPDDPGDWDWTYASKESDDLIIPTLEGKMRANVGDWIIKGVGEFYPCKPDVFEAMYEAV